jgi:hypothetical protein
MTMLMPVSLSVLSCDRLQALDNPFRVQEIRQYARGTLFHEPPSFVAICQTEETDPQRLRRSHVPNSVANVNNSLESILAVMLFGSPDGRPQYVHSVEGIVGARPRDGVHRQPCWGQLELGWLLPATSSDGNPPARVRPQPTQEDRRTRDFPNGQASFFDGGGKQVDEPGLQSTDLGITRITAQAVPADFQGQAGIRLESVF